MLSATGKKIRLGRILDPQTGRGIIIAYSHSLILGPQDGTRTVEDIERTLSACRSANAIMVPPGFVDRFVDHFVGPDKPSLFLHLDWTNFSRQTLPVGQGVQVAVAQINDVAAAGAIGVMTYLLVGFEDPEREAKEIERNAAIARECDRLGLVLLIEPRYAQERANPDLKTDLTVMSLYCRIAADLGADLIKCVWPGSVEALRTLTESCPAPVLVAGGPRRADQPHAALTLARGAVEGGARGLVFGRSVYQSEDPASTLAELQQILKG